MLRVAPLTSAGTRPHAEMHTARQTLRSMDTLAVPGTVRASDAPTSATPILPANASLFLLAALERACRAGDNDAAIQFLQQGADPFQWQNNGYAEPRSCPLVLAASRGMLRFLEQALPASPGHVPWAKQQVMQAALHAAAAADRADVVTLLLARGTHPAAIFNKTTALAEAAGHGSRAVVEVLLNAGVSPASGGALHCLCAEARHHPEALAIATLLLNHGLDVNAEHGHVTALQMLFQNVGARGYSPSQPINAVARLLIERHARVDSTLAQLAVNAAAQQHFLSLLREQQSTLSAAAWAMLALVPHALSREWRPFAQTAAISISAEYASEPPGWSMICDVFALPVTLPAAFTYVPARWAMFNQSLALVRAVAYCDGPQDMALPHWTYKGMGHGFSLPFDTQTKTDLKDAFQTFVKSIPAKVWDPALVRQAVLACIKRLQATPGALLPSYEDFVSMVHARLTQPVHAA